MTRQFAALLAVAFLCACASLEQNAYRTIGAFSISVDAAMNTWGDYVRTGKATPASEAKVLEAYEKYQASMHVARDVITSYKTHPDDNSLNMAIDTLNYSVISLEDLLLKFLPPDKVKSIRLKK